MIGHTITVVNCIGGKHIASFVALAYDPANPFAARGTFRRLAPCQALSFWKVDVCVFNSGGEDR